MESLINQINFLTTQLTNVRTELNPFISNMAKTIIVQKLTIGTIKNLITISEVQIGSGEINVSFLE
jgi:hypothetical protein